jgi:hypothetical protein
MIEVAKLIADPVPDGLVDYLDHFRDLVGATRPEDRQVIFDRMLWSCDHLIHHLPFFEHLPAGLQCPEDVAIALHVLPRVRRLLAPMVKPKATNRPTNVFKLTAAEVIVVACRHLHPRITRDRQHEVCQSYWEACGGEVGDADDWWRHCTKARTSDCHLQEQAFKACAAYVSR